MHRPPLYVNVYDGPWLRLFPFDQWASMVNGFRSTLPFTLARCSLQMWWMVILHRNTRRCLKHEIDLRNSRGLLTGRSVAPWVMATCEWWQHGGYLQASSIPPVCHQVSKQKHNHWGGVRVSPWGTEPGWLQRPCVMNADERSWQHTTIHAQNVLIKNDNNISPLSHHKKGCRFCTQWWK